MDKRATRWEDMSKTLLKSTTEIWFFENNLDLNLLDVQKAALKVLDVVPL